MGGLGDDATYYGPYDDMESWLRLIPFHLVMVAFSDYYLETVLYYPD